MRGSPGSISCALQLGHHGRESMLPKYNLVRVKAMIFPSEREYWEKVGSWVSWWLAKWGGWLRPQVR